MAYEFAVNKLKLTRAIKVIKDAGQEVTEDAVRAKYISFGGLVREKDETEEEVEEAPKKRGKKAATEETE